MAHRDHITYSESIYFHPSHPTHILSRPPGGWPASRVQRTDNTHMGLVLLGRRDGVVRPDGLAARGAGNGDGSERDGVGTHC